MCHDFRGVANFIFQRGAFVQFLISQHYSIQNASYITYKLLLT